VSVFDRLLKIAQSATSEKLEQHEQFIYPRAAQGVQSGELLASQLEILLKTLSAKSGVSYTAIKKSYQAVARANADRLKGVRCIGPYRVANGVICLEKDTRDGPVTTPLCNFAVRITEQRERDDGVERTLTFVLEGKLENGTLLPATEVSAAQFTAMNWPVIAWGTQAVVYAGQGTKDHLRTSIQLFSPDAPRRITYTHLGWREINGAHCFLHAAGVITSDAPPTVQVEPPQGLEAFALPIPPTGDDLMRAVRSSLDTLNLAPDAITVPLLGMAYRAPFDEVDFGGHLAGQTGAGKSELAAVTQQHFGAGLDSRHLPGSWSSTANALEGLAFAAKNVLAVVDDFAPEGSSHDIQRYHATAARLLRAQGNSAARGRMRADGSLRPNKPPRGMILSTGEDIPKGHSIKARIVILELEPGALDWQRLTKAQRLAAEGVYASAMAGFIKWLAQNYPARMAAFRADHSKYRAQLQSTGHKRTVDAGAQLLATYKSLLAFALEVEALTETEHAALWTRVKNGIQAALEPQTTLQTQSDPVARFWELLTGLFVSGRAHLADARSGDFPGDGWGWETHEIITQYGPELKRRANGARIGWVDGPNLYLEPAATYAELQRFARDQGDSVPLTERTLWKRLHERGVLLSREEPRLTVRKQGLAGTNQRTNVLHLAASYVTHTEPIEPSEPHPDSDDTSPPLIVVRSQTVSEPPPKNEPQTEAGGSVESGPRKKSEPQQSAPQTADNENGSVGSENEGVEMPINETKKGTSAKIEELHRLYDASELKGVSLKMPGVNIPDLEKGLEGYFSKSRRTDAENADLLKIEQAVAKLRSED
jgi:hypothetical protein